MMKKGEIERRDFLKYAATIGGGLLMGGGIPLPRMASAKAKFTLAMTGGSWGDTVKKVFVEGSGFKKKFDLDVDYSIQIDSVAVSKAILNKENPIFDVMEGFNPNGAKVLIAEAAVEELDLNILTNWPDIYPQAKMGNAYAGFCFINDVLTYNKKYVKRPESYHDLWNPKYKGHVGIPAYGWVGDYFLHAINKFFGGTEDNTMPGIEALADLMKKQKPVVPDTVDLVKKLFHAEELWIMPFWDGRTHQLIEEGAPVDFIWPKDYLSMYEGMSVMKNTRIPKIAMEFVNTTLDPNAQVEFMKVFKYAPTNRKAKIPKELEYAKVPEKEIEKAADLDWIKVVNNLEKNMELWNKKVLGG
jgi:putative spermidine/putrescine transport system substrate-binding protein